MINNLTDGIFDNSFFLDFVTTFEHFTSKLESQPLSNLYCSILFILLPCEHPSTYFSLWVSIFSLFSPLTQPSLTLLHVFGFNKWSSNYSLWRHQLNPIHLTCLTNGWVNGVFFSFLCPHYFKWWVANVKIDVVSK